VRTLVVGSPKANTTEKTHPIIIDSVRLGSELCSSIIESQSPTIVQAKLRFTRIRVGLSGSSDADSAVVQEAYRA